MNTRNTLADGGARQSAATPVAHPRKVLVPVETALAAWGNDGHIYQEKLDGCFAVVNWRGHLFAGEQMTEGEIIVWDLLATEGCDCRRWSAESRWRKLNILAGEGLPFGVVPSSCNGALLLETVLARGGEGVVRKSPGATYYDEMQAAKRGGVWLCRVAAFCGGSQSVEIEREVDSQELMVDSRKQVDSQSKLIVDGNTKGPGAPPPINHHPSTINWFPCGRVTLRGGKCDQVRIGSLIRVEGMNLTAAGKIRQPAPAREWLVQF